MSRLQTWTPDLVSLDLLLSVVELGSLGKAAAAHGMTQPSASARLSRLERRLGVQVLVRGARGTTLTAAGEAVVAWAANVVESAQALTDGVETLRANAAARLRVAASLTVAEYLMPAWLLALRRHHPEVEITATVTNSREVCDRVRGGDADLGFIESPDVPAGFSTWRVGRDRLALVASHELHQDLADEFGNEELSASRLETLPLLLREPGSGTRDTFLRSLTAALGREPRLSHAVELGSTTTILATARASGGIGVVSSRAVAGDLALHGLTEVHVRGLLAERPLTALWLGHHPSELTRELVALARASG